MEFLYLRKDEILLLLEKSAGTRYASYSEELYGQMRKMFSLFFQRFGNRAADPELIRAEFGFGKNAFKRAVGRLLKEGKIEIREKTIAIR